MAKSPLLKMLTKKVKIGKTWQNTYVIRQEYNKFRKAWFPVVLYWNRFLEKKPNGDFTFRCWVEGVFTETGRSYYHDGLKTPYDRITRPGTDKCDPEDVKAIRDFYLDSVKGEPVGPHFEVKKLGAYMPTYPR